MAFRLHKAVTSDFADPDCYVLQLVSHSSLEWIAASNSLQTVKQYSGESLELLREFKGHGSRVTDICVTGDDKFLMTLEDQGTVRLWDLRAGGGKPDGQIEYKTTATEDEFGCQTFSVNSEGRILAVGDCSVVQCFDLRKTNEASRMLEIHSDAITRAIFHPTDPCILCSASEDGTVIKSNLSVPEEDLVEWSFMPNNPGNILRYVDNGNTLGCVTSLEEVFFYNLQTGDDIFKCERENEEEYMIDFVPCTREGSQSIILFTGSKSEEKCGSIALSQIGSFEGGLERRQLGEMPRQGGHTDLVRGAVANPDCTTIYTGSEDGRLCLWKMGGDGEDEGRAKGEALLPDEPGVCIADGKARRTKQKARASPY